ncbi:MAG: response regulator [Myxococcota bacterium]|jgi:CheY-like chemotaxis protein|nr:response regulator [Myxococcota bacterium]
MPKPPLFPASAELFRLVQETAHLLSPASPTSDAEIGRIVGFESARTSRWKYGLIAVSDSARLLALSQAFDLDLTVLAHVSAGYLSAAEATAILSSEDRLIRFLTEHSVLLGDQQALTISGAEGTVGRIVRRGPGAYHRAARRSPQGVATALASDKAIVLGDDNPQTLELFRNLCAGETGLVGVATASAAEALMLVGRLSPRVLVLDLFLGGVDGFAAIKAILSGELGGHTEIVATSASLAPEITRTALGCGAVEVVQRPLRARVLSRVLAKLRTLA